MINFLILFISIIYKCFSYNIIPLSEFSKETIHFSQRQNIYLFSYYHQNQNNFTISISLFQIGGSFFDCYFYAKDSDIKQNEFGRYTGYIRESRISNSYSPDLYFSTGTYYILLTYDNKLDIDVSIMVFSSGSHTFNESFYSYFSYYVKEIEYFLIPDTNNTEYIKLGFNKILGTGSNQICLYENEDIIYMNDNYLFESTFKLQKNKRYYIHIKLNQYYTILNSFFFYIILTNYSKVFPVKKYTDNLQVFPIISSITLLLDVSDIKDYNKMQIEYLRDYKYDDLFARGYDTNDIQIIETTNGYDIKEFNNDDDEKKDDPNSDIFKKYVKINGYKNMKIMTLTAKKKKIQ